AEYEEGVVKSIKIIANPYAIVPEGLDEYFYALDYIIVTPDSNQPYKISLSEDNKVIAIEIGQLKEPKLVVSQARPIGAEISKGKVSQELTKEEEIEYPEEAVELSQEELKLTEEETIVELPYGDIDEHIIDYMHCEILDDSSLVVISTNNSVGFEVSRRYYPTFDIILKPQDTLYTDLEDTIEIENAYVKHLEIIRDNTKAVPDILDEYFYPIKHILIKPTGEFPLDFYSNDDATVTILEMYYPKPKVVVREEEKMPEVKMEKLEPKPEEIRLEPEMRKELMKELKEEIKKEGLLKEEKIAGLKKEEIEKRKQEAESMVEAIGKELLRDLFVKGKGILSLTDAQTVAVESSPKVKTAKKEVQLAKLKKREALRTLFPNVKLKASHTEGDVFEEGEFTEELYSIEAEHPLYQGRRLWNTYKQSKVNVKVAKSKYDKTVYDIDYKVAQGYYETVTAIMNIRLQKDLLQKAESVLKLAEARHNRGLSTDLEILNVRSRYNQVQFQLATAERDLALARFKLKQAMNLDINEKTIDLAEVDTELPFKVIDVNLERCLELSSENHPDILVNNLLVESNKYGAKIARGKKSFKVDLTSSYGIADSYYATEPKDLEPEWSVGIKVSKPFWGHTPSYSFSKEKTSRKLGQTDKTGSTVNAGEIALFDKDIMGVNSEIKEARINKEKAENDLIDTRRNISLEVKEAYYNYQESIIQVKNSLAKVRFQEEAVKVAKAQSELNEALQSQLLEAMIQLADEKAVYIKALSDFNLALAKLNKSVGIKNYFSVD
ncbi:MAG: TolC family protein, partial [Candidatus Omnitrophica bacterium]|nr:TolC family protein [Candidatus Omnitrophota bacterium]